MKTFVLIAALFICFSGFAQQDFDTIYAVVNGNEVTIHQDNAHRNCAFTPIPDNITINENVINWYQLDTTGMIAVCMCYFNYAITIDTLSPGEYTVNVYSGYNSIYISDTAYEGTTNFTIAGPYQGSNALHLASYAGPCHEYDGIKKHPTAQDQYTISQNPDGLSIKSIGTSKINKVVLSDMSGQEVLKKEYNSVSEIYLPTSTLNKGFYIITVYDTNRMMMNKKVAIFPN